MRRHQRAMSQRWAGLVVACWIVFWALDAPWLQAQVLATTPSCGQKGANIQVTGSGWAEPAPVCEYLFYFDGVEIPPRQADGLFGPPNRTLTIPATATAGQHTLKVELRLTTEGTLLQCRQVPFKVISTPKNPWAGGITTRTEGGINIAFDPTDVCDVEPCKKIVMIQVIRMLGQNASGTNRTLTFAEQGFRNATVLDADVTTAGYTVDYQYGEGDPYYNGDDAGIDGIQQGFQNGTPIESIIDDTPGRPDGAYPTGITKIILEFEVATFCAEGIGKGKFLGTMKWKWERPKGGTPVATFLSSSRNAPSAYFTVALNRWNTNHNFTLPTPGTVTTGGQPCK